MKKKKPVRNYKMQDAELYFECKTTAAMAERDLDEFSEYGVTKATLESFLADATAFINQTSDSMIVASRAVVNEEKETVAEDLRVAIRELMHRVQGVYATNTATYRKFGTDYLTRKKDHELLSTATKVYRAGTKLLPELAKRGVTVALLDNIRSLRNKMEELKIEAEDLTTDRDVLQEERIQKGNILYATLVDLCGTGCRIWETKSPARYDDYIIYKTVPKKKREEEDDEDEAEKAVE